MKAIRILIKGNKKPRVFIEHLKSYKNSRYGRSDRIRTCGIVVPNHARYQLRYTPKTSKDAFAENCLPAKADRLFGFVFLYYTMFVSKSQDFLASFSALVQLARMDKKYVVFFCACLKGRENGEGGKAAREA